MERFPHIFISVDSCTVILWIVILLLSSLGLYFFWYWIKPLEVLEFLLHVAHRFFSCLVEPLSFVLHLSLVVDLWNVHYFVDPEYFHQNWCVKIVCSYLDGVVLEIYYFSNNFTRIKVSFWRLCRNKDSLTKSIRGLINSYLLSVVGKVHKMNYVIHYYICNV